MRSEMLRIAAVHATAASRNPERAALPGASMPSGLLETITRTESNIDVAPRVHAWIRDNNGVGDTYFISLAAGMGLLVLLLIVVAASSPVFTRNMQCQLETFLVKQPGSLIATEASGVDQPLLIKSVEPECSCEEHKRLNAASPTEECC